MVLVQSIAKLTKPQNNKESEGVMKVSPDLCANSSLTDVRSLFFTWL